MQARRAVLLAILAVALSLSLLDAHGSPRQVANDLRDVALDIKDRIQNHGDQ
jgi:hypothetical protein